VTLSIIPCKLDAANVFIRRHHRHHGPLRFHKFSLAVVDGEGTVRGVAIVGRPVSRALDDGRTLEVSRVATDGVHNGCSMLYGACRRAAFALGYRRLITYVLSTEPGTSLRAAGWKCAGEIRGKPWNTPRRPRVDKHPLQNKCRWEAEAA
jgi:hypothetical protein